MRSKIKWLAHKFLFPLIEHANAAILRVLGIPGRSKARKLEFSGTDRVLVLAPHPDDETLGCGGTIRSHLCAGDTVQVVIVTDGRRSRAGGLCPDEMVSARRVEAQLAMRELFGQTSDSPGNINLVQLQLPEGEWECPDLDLLLAHHITSFQPTVIYTTSSVDFHPEHLNVAQSVARTLRSAELTGPVRVRVYELQVPLTTVLVNVFADISESKPYKDKALTAYGTQRGSFTWVPRHDRYLRAVFGVCGPIEVFWELDLRQFIEVHSDGSRRTFRSIRLRPLTDLLSWCIGMKARKELRKMAGNGTAQSE